MTWIGLLIALLSPPQVKFVASEASCERIEGIDLNDAKLSIESQPLHFRDGKACTSDEGIVDGCDWEHILTVDQSLVPQPGQTIRLIVINSNHLTGSGAWDHVLFLQCRNGRLVSEFSESYLSGVKIEKRSNTELWLVSGEWLKGNPTCCPSRQRKEIFRWDPKKHAFSVSSRRGRRHS